MRTTIDLPDDLHTVAKSIARSQGRSLSETIADILRSVLVPPVESRLHEDHVTGLLVVDLGRPITSEEIAAYEDEELDELLNPGRSM